MAATETEAGEAGADRRGRRLWRPCGPAAGGKGSGLAGEGEVRAVKCRRLREVEWSGRNEEEVGLFKKARNLGGRCPRRPGPTRQWEWQVGFESREGFVLCLGLGGGLVSCGVGEGKDTWREGEG